MAMGAVLFDLDGTLLNSLRDIADSLNAVLARMGFAIHNVEAYRDFVGAGMEQLLSRALPPGHCAPADLEECISAFTKEYALRWCLYTRPYPGIPELLNGLAERSVPLAIVSNKPAAFTRMAVERFLSGWTFKVIVGAVDGRPKKPDPTTSLEAAEKLGVDPSACLFLGDCGSDMETALAAGMVPVGVLWGFRDKEELSAAGARYLLKVPADLIPLLFD